MTRASRASRNSRNTRNNRVTSDSEAQSPEPNDASAPETSTFNASNKRCHEEEHEARKCELEIQILEQKLVNERAQSETIEQSNSLQQ